MTKIENNMQYEWAVKRVEELLPLVNDSTPIDDPNSIELELLSNLVADYSEEHYSIGEPTLVDVIKLRMYEMGLTEASLGKLLNISASRVSEILSGKCEPTLRIARAISVKLNIDACIFSEMDIFCIVNGLLYSNRKNSNAPPNSSTKVDDKTILLCKDNLLCFLSLKYFIVTFVCFLLYLILLI